MKALLLVLAALLAAIEGWELKTKATFCSSKRIAQKQKSPSVLHSTRRYATSPSDPSEQDPLNEETESSAVESNQRRKIRQRVTDLARNMVIRPLSYAAPMPQAIASVLKEGTLGAVEMAVEEVMNRRNNKKYTNRGEILSSLLKDQDALAVDMQELIEDAFLPLEKTLEDMEASLQSARSSLEQAKRQATVAIGAVQAAAIAQAEGAVEAVAAAEERMIADIFASTNNVNVSALAFEDVDYDTSEMAPPFLDEDQCLIPGEPVVRVEKAPENSRRIFAGIDIMASVDDVWRVLTDYENLQKVVPNLVLNDVLERFPGSRDEAALMINSALPEEKQCQQLCEKMKGALLKQIGGAKVAGINFSARTTLEVREWPFGMPDFAHFNDELWGGKTRKQRAKEYARVKLERYRFPRPFAISSLPTRDISMQSIENDDGEFRMYQGVWRMQPLPGCAPSGKQAMRLTYAVEVSPRAYLPVQLVEGRIVKDLCTNLEAIRDYVAQAVPSR